jgi:Polyketide cyclase / dehydrase and lipid transport
MPRAHAEETGVVPATPDEVYAVYADYRNSHPQILPKPEFSDLVVEEGGRGAGTVFRVKTKVLSVERAYHMDVTEPVPGRKLIETDRDTGLATTFTLTPVNGGQQTHVRISTEWDTASGIAGRMEALMTPFFMRRIYKKQLGQLRNYLQNRQP